MTEELTEKLPFISVEKEDAPPTLWPTEATPAFRQRPTNIQVVTDFAEQAAQEAADPSYKAPRRRLI